MNRRLLLLLALLLLLLTGHLGFWYLPREHAAEPRRQDVPWHLFAGGDYAAAAWIPYPHQNLAHLRGEVEEPGEWLAAAARLAGLPPPELPAFGPFSAPPARELAIASDLAGERVAVAARVYPLLTGIARVAGKLAGNPWLAGGEVSAFGGRARVEWHGTLWTVSSVAAVPPAVDPLPGSAPAAPASLAALRLEEARGMVPAGIYRLGRSPGALEIATLEGPPENLAEPQTDALLEPLATRLDDTGAVLLTLTGGGSPGALLLFGGGTESGFDFPGAASLARGGRPEDRFRLPHERLPRFLLRRLPRAEEAEWRILASDRDSLDRAVELAGDLDALAADDLRRLVWARPGPLTQLVARGAEVLDSIPLISGEETRRWRDWGIVLAPFGRFESIALVVQEPRRPGDTPALRLRFAG